VSMKAMMSSDIQQ